MTDIRIALKSTFGVHYSTGSAGQLGLRVGGFPGSLCRWVTKCDPVPCLMQTFHSAAAIAAAVPTMMMSGV